MCHRARLVGLVLALNIVILSGSSLAAPPSGQSTTNSPARPAIFREAEDGSASSVVTSKRGDNEDGRAQHGLVQASDRLMKAFKDLRKSESYKHGVMDAELVNDNLYEWNVRLFFPDPATNLHQDLKELKETGRGEDYVLFRVTFESNFPRAPPFVRVLRPAMGRSMDSVVKRTGAICAQILSRQGWQSDFTIEGLFLSLADLLIAEDDRVASDQSTRRHTDEEARKEYKLIERYHTSFGWL